MTSPNSKILQMTWSPLEKLNSASFKQQRFTDAAGNQGFLKYYNDNGVHVRSLVEHAHFFPNAVASTGLNAMEKAQQFGNLLLPPANAIFARVLQEQQDAGVDDLEDILKAYIDKRLGEHGMRAAYRQLEGLKTCKKPRSIACFEWEVLFTTANNIVQWLPGPEAALTDETLRRAYLDSFPTKWITSFEEIKTTDMGNTTMSAITAFMTEKESASQLAQAENESKQRSQNKKSTDKSIHKKGTQSKFKKKDDQHKVGRPKDDEQCRLHPYHSHTWGECNYHPNNQGNKNKTWNKTKSNANTKKKDASEDGHVVQEPTIPEVASLSIADDKDEMSDDDNDNGIIPYDSTFSHIEDDNLRVSFQRLQEKEPGIVHYLWCKGQLGKPGK